MSSSSDILVDLIVHPYCVQDEHFISLISAGQLLSIASKIDSDDPVSEKIKKCAKRINKFDNPVLVRFNLKSFSTE
jgi:hypothetical protein